jgi:hypothetical protein
MTVNQERATALQPVAPQIGRGDGDARIPFPKDGAFAGLGVNKDERSLAGGISSRYPMGFDAFAGHFAFLEITGSVVSNLPDITGPQTPTLACDHCAGNLAAWFSLGGDQLYF